MHVGVCVRPAHAAEWVSDLWIMQSAHRRGRRVLCCGVLMRGEAGGRQARRAAEHTENDSSNSGKPGYK